MIPAIIFTPDRHIILDTSLLDDYRLVNLSFPDGAIVGPSEPTERIIRPRSSFVKPENGVLMLAMPWP